MVTIAHRCLLAGESPVGKDGEGGLCSAGCCQPVPPSWGQPLSRAVALPGPPSLGNFCPESDIAGFFLPPGLFPKIPLLDSSFPETPKSARRPPAGVLCSNSVMTESLLACQRRGGLPRWPRTWRDAFRSLLVPARSHSGSPPPQVPRGTPLPEPLFEEHLDGCYLGPRLPSGGSSAFWAGLAVWKLLSVAGGPLGHLPTGAERDSWGGPSPKPPGGHHWGRRGLLPGPLWVMHRPWGLVGARSPPPPRATFLAPRLLG